ncbi:alpha-amylase family glycosyl hydrolase [Vibrio sp. SCSIO 43136]|uniref:alpha-amylase family glycosyl hydrolase n=1 Tax=Vibrio sp. SCSIO 43136 TaxID=2819101 RepID=UPI0020750309|nr:alpha-amylase family glycosyl hydrolase [Vibrio sp. SCSIO 43136]USD67580.1 glycosidase [Vibrio sp. SCSIO 43136]
MNFSKSIISLSLAAALAGCGSSGSDDSGSETSLPIEQYACSAEEGNDLRIYQVMVESFVNGDTSIGHGTGYGTSHHMGDIQGIIDSLDYIESLGMNAIWLTPVFDSVAVSGQDHWADRLDATGYFATNYFAIDPRFGTMEKAKELVEKAHAKGLYVFFDGVFGHHKDNVVASPTGKRPSGGSNPVDYPQSLEFYKEVAQYWVTELKIDGWRLDQAYQVPTSAWVQLRKAVDEASQSVTYVDKDGAIVNPLGYMVAEIWNNENYIKETGYGEEGSPALCSAFDFPVRYRMVETFGISEGGTGGKGGDWLNQGMSLHSVYPDHATPNLMLGNHDLVRFGDLLQRGNIAEPNEAEYWQRHRAVFSFQAAYTGPITTYYGEEIGDQLDGFADKVETDCAIQGWCDDHVARTSGKVEGVTGDVLDANQQALKAYISELMQLRKDHPALSNGVRTNVVANQNLYVDHKQGTDEALLYVVSTSDQAQTVTLSGEHAGSEGAIQDLQTSESIALASGNYQFDLDPFEARFFKVIQPSAAGPISSWISSGSDEITGDAFMGQCDNPDVSGSGPISSQLYVVGETTDWKHLDERRLTYKGQNVYQLVINENAGSARMQFAASTWDPQYSATGLELKVNQEVPLGLGGYGKDSSATLFESGRYVYSLKFSDAGQPTSVMLAKCK